MLAALPPFSASCRPALAAGGRKFSADVPILAFLGHFTCGEDCNLATADGPKGYPTTAEWLESPYLLQAVEQAASRHGLTDACFQDLVQEVRIALWELGLAVRV